MSYRRLCFSGKPANKRRAGPVQGLGKIQRRLPGGGPGATIIMVVVVGRIHFEVLIYGLMMALMPGTIMVLAIGGLSVLTTMVLMPPSSWSSSNWSSSGSSSKTTPSGGPVGKRSVRAAVALGPILDCQVTLTAFYATGEALRIRLAAVEVLGAWKSPPGDNAGRPRGVLGRRSAARPMEDLGVF